MSSNKGDPRRISSSAGGMSNSPGCCGVAGSLNERKIEKSCLELNDSASSFMNTVVGLKLDKSISISEYHFDRSSILINRGQVEGRI